MNKMNKFIKFVVVSAGAFLLLSAFGFMESTYERDATVCKIADGITFFEDSCGNRWSSNIEHEFNVGDSVVLVMDNNGTDTIRDDTVKSVK